MKKRFKKSSNHHIFYIYNKKNIQKKLQITTYFINTLKKTFKKKFESLHILNKSTNHHIFLYNTRKKHSKQSTNHHIFLYNTRKKHSKKSTNHNLIYILKEKNIQKNPQITTYFL
jgi:hypothetical protein